MRDVIDRFDLCSYGLVAYCLFAAAQAAARQAPRFAPAMYWAFVVALLAVGGWGYAEIRPGGTLEGVAIAVVAVICASAAALATAVVVAPVATVYDRRKRAAAERAWAAERQREAEAERAERARQAAEERQEELTRQLLANPKPRPRAERVAEAKAKYDATLKLLEAAGLSEVELRGAKEKAKQEYLRELDEVLSDSERPRRRRTRKR